VAEAVSFGQGILGLWQPALGGLAQPLRGLGVIAGVVKGKIVATDGIQIAFLDQVAAVLLAEQVLGLQVALFGGCFEPEHGADSVLATRLPGQQVAAQFGLHFDQAALGRVGQPLLIECLLHEVLGLPVELQQALVGAGVALAGGQQVVETCRHVALAAVGIARHSQAGAEIALPGARRQGVEFSLFDIGVGDAAVGGGLGGQAVEQGEGAGECEGVAHVDSFHGTGAGLCFRAACGRP